MIFYFILLQVTSLLGVGNEYGEDAILGRLEGMKEIIEKVNKQFKDPVRTFFRMVIFQGGPSLHFIYGGLN